MLVKLCIIDIVPFTIYLMIWLIMMTLIYQRLGFEATGYQGIEDNSFVNFFLQVWENSIGNITPPSFDDKKITSKAIIGAIYGIWFIN